jgi:hypothetical protein
MTCLQCGGFAWIGCLCDTCRNENHEDCRKQTADVIIKEKSDEEL